MSWPDDLPRYVLQTVTGYRITADAVTGSGAPPTCAQVLDRAYAFKVVAEFIPTGFGHGPTKKSSQCIGEAEALVRKLNAEDADDADE